MVETIKDRYNKMLTVAQRVCNNYANRRLTNSKDTRNKLKIDLYKSLGQFESNGYIEKLEVRCDESLNPENLIKRGEMSFMFGIEWKGEKHGARHTFGVRKI